MMAILFNKHTHTPNANDNDDSNLYVYQEIGYNKKGKCEEARTFASRILDFRLDSI